MPCGDADAAGDALLRADRGRFDGFAKPFAQDGGLRSVVGLTEDDKFFAAPAVEGFFRGEFLANQVGEIDEHSVAHVVPIVVVDFLEKVDVEHKDGDGKLGNPRQRNGFLHVLVEFPAVEAFRQRIDFRALDGAGHFDFQRAGQGDKASLFMELLADQGKDEIGESEYGKGGNHHQVRNPLRKAQETEDAVQDHDERQNDDGHKERPAVAAIVSAGAIEADTLDDLQKRHADEEDGNHGHEAVLVREGLRKRKLDIGEDRELQRDGDDSYCAVSVKSFFHDRAEFPVHNFQDNFRAADGHQVEHGEQYAPPKSGRVPEKHGAVARAEHPCREDDQEKEAAAVQAAQFRLVHVIDADDYHEHKGDGQIDEIRKVKEEETPHLVGIRADGHAHKTPQADRGFGIHLEGNRVPVSSLVGRKRDEMPAPAVTDLLVRKRSVLIDEFVVLPDTEGLVDGDEKKRVDVRGGGIKPHAKPDII